MLSIYYCSSLTMNIWDKWSNNPVIISFAETRTPVWKIPFPAVTLCSETKHRKSLFKYQEVLMKILNNITLTDEE